MKVRRLNDVREQTSSPEFKGWWDTLVKARMALADAEAHREELLAQLNLMEFRAELTQKNAIDTLYRAGEHEDRAARLLVESEELENRSFPGVAAFEEQRFKVSEIWYRLGASEKELEDAKAAKRDLAYHEKRHRQVAEEYEREESRKNRLWEEVERLWARSAEVSLLTSEQKVLARKVRRDAEQLFGLAEERKKKAQALRAETETAAHAVDSARVTLDTTLGRARELFGCAVGTDFVYFRHRDDQRQAFAVALVEDRENYNVEVKPLAVYSVDRSRGVALLEPARAQPVSLEEGDKRFEDYFLKGRKGEVRPSAGA